jgi:L-fuconate dehydratase
MFSSANACPFRLTEHAGHLHEHFKDPIAYPPSFLRIDGLIVLSLVSSGTYFFRMRNGRYVAPSKPGYSAEMFPESIAKYSFPNGEEWRGDA